MPTALRVLLIDHDTSLIQVITDHLTRHGTEVFACHGECSALDAAAHHYFDAALVDRSLTDDACLLLVEKLHQAHPRLPILLLSKRSDEGYIRAAHAAGVTRLMAKPCTASEVDEALRSLVSSPSLAAGA